MKLAPVLFKLAWQLIFFLAPIEIGLIPKLVVIGGILLALEYRYDSKNLPKRIRWIIWRTVKAIIL